MSEPSAWPRPPYRITTPRLVIRAYERADVEAVHAGILENVEALRPWMPWIADEPLTREARSELLRMFRGKMDLGQDFIFGVFEPDGTYVGGTGLHPRQSPGALEIGYWIIPERWGLGYATELAAALTQVGFGPMRAGRMEIRVAPDNPRSLRVPVKLGYQREGQLRNIGRHGDGSLVDLVVYGMLAAELEGSPAAALEIETDASWSISGAGEG